MTPAPNFGAMPSIQDVQREEARRRTQALADFQASREAAQAKLNADPITDARVAGGVTGPDQPASARSLCTAQQAEELKLDLIISGIAPRDGSTRVTDRPDLYGADLIRGSDGKSYFVISWAEPDPAS